MRGSVSSGGREGYATAVTGLWRGLSGALTQLEAVASDPDLLDDDALPELSSLQYALHLAAELAVGIEPPDGAESAHAELAAALAGARDATAEVAEAIEIGGPLAAEPLVPEWRGALFRVRLARMRVADAKPAPASAEEETERPRFPVAALVATVLAVTGAAVFAAGATAEAWPVWAIGLVLFCSAVLIFQPRP